MYLEGLKRDGTRYRFAPAQNVYQYARAAAMAEAHLRAYPQTVALYLWSDGGEKIVRSYLRNPPWYTLTDDVMEHLLGEHAPYDQEPVMYPGRFPDCRDAGAASCGLTNAELGQALEDADFKGYVRGFNTGLRHRNKPEHYGVGPATFATQALQMGKSYSLEEAHQARDRLRRAYPLPGSVRAGVWGTRTGRWPCGDRRPEFTVDLGHNRR